MATLWSIIANRMDKIGQRFWTEWRLTASETATGARDVVPLTAPGGQIDPSFIPAGSSLIIDTLESGEPIGAFQVVAVHSDGLAYIASSTNIADASQTVGIAITSAPAIGVTLQVQQIGFLSNIGWNWTPLGATLYLGVGGTLTTNPNTGLFELPLGTTLSNTDIEVQIGTPIIFA